MGWGEGQRDWPEGSKKVNTFGFGQINPLNRNEGGVFILIEFAAVIHYQPLRSGTPGPSATITRAPVRRIVDRNQKTKQKYKR